MDDDYGNDPVREFEDGDIICPSCGNGRIEISTKIYFDVKGTMLDMPEEGYVVQAEDLIVSPINDTLGGAPFNTEAELFCGCEACGEEFPVVWSDKIREHIDYQSDRT